MTLPSSSQPLNPRMPPGRANRKALAYTAEIHRLRRLGYTFEAIRLALREVGVDVGATTVKREASRVADGTRPVSMGPASALTAESADAAAPSVAPLPSIDKRSYGKDIAAAFARSHISHPLVKP